MNNYRQKIIRTLDQSPPSQTKGIQKKSAAVLVPIIEKDEPHILLTRRADHLSSHAGQVSFPGGHWESSDTSLIHTALREAEEEVGLHSDFVEVLGVLPTHRSGKGQPMVPIVAAVSAEASFLANPDEVADIFSAPLSFLMDFNNYQLHEHAWQGKNWSYYSTHWEGFQIWGATANILRSFYDKVFREGDTKDDQTERKLA